MFNKRIATGLMSIAGAFAIAGGATFAYFTDTATSTANTFTAGTMNISVDQTNIQSTAVIDNWVPGQEVPVRFNIKNDGTTPVNLRAFAMGIWNNNNLNPEQVKVIKAEYHDGSNWVLIKQSLVNGLDGYIYYSPNGNNSNLTELAPGAQEQFRLTVKLDESAGNEYQGKIFRAKIQAEAKQTNVGVDGWPVPSLPTF